VAGNRVFCENTALQIAETEFFQKTRFLKAGFFVEARQPRFSKVFVEAARGELQVRSGVNNKSIAPRFAV
jgi:hypothetical protein